MATEGPLITSLISRLNEPQLNLAAFGVAFAFALILESPVIMLMAASTALVRGPSSYRLMRKFTLLLIFLVTATTALVLIQPVFMYLVVNIIGLPDRIADLTYDATLLLLPWPGAIGFRRFYQGILIAGGKTKSVALGSVLRIGCMAATCISLFLWSELDGASIGGLSLSVGVCVEAMIVRVIVRRPLASLLTKSDGASDVNSLGEVSRFYYPLALQSFLGLALQPIVTFFVSRCVEPIQSLAVLPVINAYVFIFRCVGLSFNEVIIALLRDEHGSAELKKFAVLVGGVSSGVFLLIGFTPLLPTFLTELSGLTPEMTQFSILPFQLMVLIPPLALVLSWQRSLCVLQNQTFYISRATFIEVLMTVLVMSASIQAQIWNGAITACLGVGIGRLSGVFYLFIARKRVPAP